MTDGAPQTAQCESTWQRLAPLWAALLAMAPFAGVVLGSSELYYDDHFRFSTPLMGFVAETLRSGHLPLWNPWNQIGAPLIAERGSMVIHPGTLLGLCMGPSHAVGTLMVLCLGLLAAGSAAFLRSLAVPSALAVAAGAAIGLSGPALSVTTNATYLATLAFLPWLLLFARRLALAARGGSRTEPGGAGLARMQGGAKRGILEVFKQATTPQPGPNPPERRRGDFHHGLLAQPAVLGGGLCLGMALLGGDLFGAFFFAILALLVFWASGGSWRRSWLSLTAIAGLGLAIGAGSWFPVVWGLPLSERGQGIVAAQAGRWSFHPGELLGLIWPHPMGLPLPKFTFWPLGWLKHERLFYHSWWIGALLAVSGLLALRPRGPRMARVMMLAALALLLPATGSWTPLWTLWRPLFTFFRYPSKLAAPAIILWALAGTLSLHALLPRSRSVRRLCLTVAGLASLGTIVGPTLLNWLARRIDAAPEIAQPAAAALRTGTLRVALLAALGAAIFYMVDRGRLSAGKALVLLSALVFIDVFSTTVDLAWTRTPEVTAVPSILPDVGPRGARIMRLSEVSATRLGLDEESYTHEQLRQAALFLPQTNLAWHVSVLDPYGFYLADVGQGMAELNAVDPTLMAELTATDVVLASQGARAPWLLDALKTHRLRPRQTLAAGAVALAVSTPRPRSFLTTAAALAPRAQIAQRLGSAPEHLVITDGRTLLAGGTAQVDLATLLAGLPEQGTDERVPVDPVVWRPGAARYRLSTTTASLLVEMDAFTPGWHVLIDGHEQPLLQANLLGRAVLVPPGQHEVEWRFEPRTVIFSIWLSWTTLAATLLRLLLSKRIRKSRGTPGTLA